MAYQNLNQPQRGHLRQRSQTSLETGTTSPVSPRGNSDWVDPFGENTQHKRHIYQLWLILRYLVLKIVIPFAIVLVALNYSDVYSRGTSGSFGDVRLSYGNDVRYGSLDRKYDFLWQDDIAPELGIVRLPKDMSLGPADETELGMIGM